MRERVGNSPIIVQSCMLAKDAATSTEVGEEMVQIYGLHSN